MSSGQVFVSPSYAPRNIPLIFLAGPIQGTDDWQSTAIKTIQSIDASIHIASPRRPHFDKNTSYDEQVDWETHHLRQAGKNGVIMFWLAKETQHIQERAYAQTSRAELFEWKVQHERDGTKLVIGIDEGFSGERYIRKRFDQDCPDIPILSSLTKTCQQAVNELRGKK